MNRSDLLELVETELDANASTVARSYHELLLQGITAQIDMETELELLLGSLSELHPETITSLVLPAFKYRLFENLAVLLRETAEGWSDVFYGNLNDEYDEGRLQ